MMQLITLVPIPELVANAIDAGRQRRGQSRNNIQDMARIAWHLFIHSAMHGVVILLRDNVFQCAPPNASSWYS
jgi:hypothetical protein